MTPRRRILSLVLLTAVALLAATLRILIDRTPGGVVSLALPEASFASFRYSALAAGIIVGAALGVSGLLLQALLRNPLASPFILGVSSGAGLGVMATLTVAYLLLQRGGTVPGVGATTLPAVAGALGTLGIVYSLSRRRGALDPLTLLLIGVVMSTICGAGIMFCQHLVPTGIRGEFTAWLMGRIPEATPPITLAVVGGLVLVGILISTRLGRAMDAAALGDDEARSVGLALGRLRVILFITAGILAAVTVALAGPIGFVGLIAPHAARLILGPRHTALVWGAALCGVILVVGSDITRQAIDLGGGRMPIGILTSLIGGPAFIWLLLRGRSFT